jgi:hypothetical protein
MYVHIQIALNIRVALSFLTHAERLNCIMGIRTRRSCYIVNRLSYDIGWALAAPWQHDALFVSYELGCVMLLLCHTRLIGPLPLSRTVIAESRIFCMPCRHCSSVVIIEPQLHLLRTLCGLVLYPDYRVTTAPVAFVTKACCVVVALMAADALTPDTLELVFAWIVVGCSSPWSHITLNLRKQSCLALYFIWLCCVTSYIYIYRQVAITTISSPIVLGNLGN